MAGSLPVGGRSLTAGLALALTAGFSLSGCAPSTRDAAQQTGQAAKDGAGLIGQAALTAAKATGKVALSRALTPVLELLTKAEAEVKAGNLAAAASTVGGFQALWATAAPMIEPVAADKWPAIDAAATQVLDTFGAGTSLTASKAEGAISGLIASLKALQAP